MRRFVPLFACFSVMALGLSTARGEFDSSGSQAGPVQLQANRPPQAQNLDYARLLKLVTAPPAGVVVIDVSGDTVLVRVVGAPPARLVKPKPGPMKKPVPKPRKAPRFDKAEDLGVNDW